MRASGQRKGVNVMRKEKENHIYTGKVAVFVASLFSRVHLHAIELPAPPPLNALSTALISPRFASTRRTNQPSSLSKPMSMRCVTVFCTRGSEKKHTYKRVSMKSVLRKCALSIKRKPKRAGEFAISVLQFHYSGVGRSLVLSYFTRENVSLMETGIYQPLAHAGQPVYITESSPATQVSTNRLGAIPNPTNRSPGW